jgi:ribosomal protein S18 acetylase RimI-like enzyme
MELRPVQTKDLDLLSEIDGTIQSRDYLHVERSAPPTPAGGEADDDGAAPPLAAGWRLAQRPLRERLVRPNPLGDDARLVVKMIATGADEGLALMAEHDGMPVALAVATPDHARGVLRLVDLRVDFDTRRQGLATALLYSVVAAARDAELRAVAAETTTDNAPAAALLAKCGFELAGLDERRLSNHDLVKETVTLFWYMSLD